MTRRRGTGQTTSIRASAAITAFERACAFATRGHVDLETLSNQSVDALLGIRSIDILIIAENRAARSFTLHAAATFELGVTLNVAIQIDRRGTRACTTRIAMFRAVRGLNLALATTIAGAAGLGIFNAIAIGMFRFAIGNKGLFALFVTTSNAIEFGGVTLRDTAHAAVVGAAGIRRKRTTSTATSLELDRRTFSVTTAGNDDATICDASVFGHELAALGRHFERQSRRRSEQHRGKSKKRKSEFAEVCHEVCPFRVTSKSTRPDDRLAHRSHTDARPRDGRASFAKLHA